MFTQTGIVSIYINVFIVLCPRIAPPVYAVRTTILVLTTADWRLCLPAQASQGLYEGAPLQRNDRGVCDVVGCDLDVLRLYEGISKN